MIEEEVEQAQALDRELDVFVLILCNDQPDSRRRFSYSQFTLEEVKEPQTEDRFEALDRQRCLL